MSSDNRILICLDKTMSRERSSICLKTAKETAEQVSVPDFSELWKNLYFNNEAIWAEAFKDYLSTKSFVNMMDTSLDKHLTLEKLTRQNLENSLKLPGSFQTGCSQSR